MPRILAAAVLTAVLAAACLAGPGDPAPAPTATRAEEVRRLRVAVAQPAVQLVEAGRRLTAAVRALRTEPIEDPETRRANVTAVRSDALAALRVELNEAEDVDLAGGGRDAAAVRNAWTGLLDAAADVLAAAEAELELIGRLAAVEIELRELTAVWDEPGSRQHQLDTFAQTADRAEALAEELEQAATSIACPQDVQRRARAARFVAEATRELRGYVARHQGNTFDRRRGELAQDPFGLGGTLLDVDAACWRERSATATSSAALDTRLRALEQALNPPELASPGPGPTGP